MPHDVRHQIGRTGNKGQVGEEQARTSLIVPPTHSKHLARMASARELGFLGLDGRPASIHRCKPSLIVVILGSPDVDGLSIAGQGVETKELGGQN